MAKVEEGEVDQTITGKNIFRDIEGPNPTENADAANKGYAYDNFLIKIKKV